jgi:hypothetical protein
MPLMARLRAIFGPRRRRAANAQPHGADPRPEAPPTLGAQPPPQAGAYPPPGYRRRRGLGAFCCGGQRIRNDAYVAQPQYVDDRAYRHRHTHGRRVYAY